MARQSSPKAVLGLDVGSARIGVAVGSRQARMPRPVSIIPHSEGIMDELKELVVQEDVDLIVVGLPRNMDGLETQQSNEIRKFTKKLQNITGIETTFADESLSSVRAEVSEHGYRSTSADKHLDDIAACLILEEFFNENRRL